MIASLSYYTQLLWQLPITIIYGSLSRQFPHFLELPVDIGLKTAVFNSSLRLRDSCFLPYHPLMLLTRLSSSLNVYTDYSLAKFLLDTACLLMVISSLGLGSCGLWPGWNCCRGRDLVWLRGRSCWRDMVWLTRRSCWRD